MTDKAVHEKDVLREAFPDARQLLCQWHVVTWLKKQAARLAGPVKKEVKGLLSLMVYAKTDEEYGYAKGAMLEKLGGNDSHPLYNIFMENWDNSQDDWVSFKRGNVPHLTNNTNNRIESKWGKIKDVIKDTFSIDELLSTLITLQEYAEDQYIDEYHRVGGRPSGLCEDEELSSLALQISKFAFNLVSEQYAFANGGSADYEVELGSPCKASIKSPRTGNAYEVSTMRSKCDCIFMNTCLLPCRHVMFVRNHCNYETVIPPMRSFSTRWIVHSPVNNIAERDVARGGLKQITCSALSQQSPVSTTDMYIEAKAVAEKIIDRMALQSTPTYRVALQWLQDFYGALNSGDVIEFSQREATFLGLSQVSSVGATRLSQNVVCRLRVPTLC
ncbi:hypothetical protein PR003_g16385 [Phytophthora rubi]|uniref:SWIM-type domain-containing protein n=1 Tax=Phytophthora rubi TaxID=129364 RepID=A0A6A4EZJ4_9STRA|nr:hypothetical protein PR003_g16385 [Phytophthora rubi]